MNERKLKKRDLAAALGIDSSLISRYVKRGMPIHSVEAALEWKTANVRPRVKANQSGQHGLFDYDESRARREHFAATLVETEARKAIGELIDRSEVIAEIERAATMLRIHLMEIGPRLAVRLVGLAEDDIRRLIDAEVTYGLEAAAHAMMAIGS